MRSRQSSYETAITGEHEGWKTRIQHKTWTAEQVAEQMYQRLKSIDDESEQAADPKDRTSYAKKFTRQRCEAIVIASLKHAKIRNGKITDDNRQKFLQALGPLRRKSAKRVIYKLSPQALQRLKAGDRQDESCSAAELRRGSKTVFFPPDCEASLVDEQKEFFRELIDDDGEFVPGRLPIVNAADFKTPANFVIADAQPERKFIRELVTRQNAMRIDAWLKNTNIGFYSIEYAWKKGEHPKRGEFSPDFFIKQGDAVHVVEIKGDEEIADPAPESVKKYEYAAAHFGRLNDWLKKERIQTRYYFNMVSPKSYPLFFQRLREGGLPSFRSELDVTMTKAAKLWRSTLFRRR